MNAFLSPRLYERLNRLVTQAPTATMIALQDGLERRPAMVAPQAQVQAAAGGREPSGAAQRPADHDSTQRVSRPVRLASR